LRRLVAELPPERRGEIVRRFTAAVARLTDAGLVEPMRSINQLDGKELETLGLDYFRLGLACPFLEDESCSIYADRPLVCREYLVTSPAELCAAPSATTIERVPIPIAVNGIAARLGGVPTGLRRNVVPLVFALAWDADGDAPDPQRTGPEWVWEMLQLFCGKTPSAELPPPTTTSEAAP
ncbi:MAG: YkgJ family cysteine cluster protein, partial [Planctomycetia bacterium]